MLACLRSPQSFFNLPTKHYGSSGLWLVLSSLLCAIGALEERVGCNLLAALKAEPLTWFPPCCLQVVSTSRNLHRTFEVASVNLVSVGKVIEVWGRSLPLNCNHLGCKERERTG
eukprot:1141706-Pelagomonas_calceolata.AAC.2